MQALTELVLLKSKKGWFFKREAVAWVGRSGEAFDGLLKRALAVGEVLRVARGLYCLKMILLLRSPTNARRLLAALNRLDLGEGEVLPVEAMALRSGLK